MNLKESNEKGYSEKGILFHCFRGLFWVLIYNRAIKEKRDIMNVIGIIVGILLVFVLVVIFAALMNKNGTNKF